jgi:DNA-binding FadR family transcriptional regulator
VTSTIPFARPEQVDLATAKRGRDNVIVDALVALIEREGLGVGDRLPPEIELAERLGVARSTIREVLKSWQSMGIVTRNKGRGHHAVGRNIVALDPCAADAEA